MARHKQLQTEEQGDPEMNISSLIDCVFLLLIYFIVATSLVSEKKLDISIPATEGQASSKPPLDPGKISVRGDGTTFWRYLMPTMPLWPMQRKRMPLQPLPTAPSARWNSWWSSSSS